MMLKNLKKRIVTSAILFILLFLALKYQIDLIITLMLIGVFSIIEFFNLSIKF